MFTLFAVLGGVGVIFLFVGARLRKVARSRKYGEVKIHVMPASETDPEEKKGGEFDALRGEMSALHASVPGLPTIPRTEIEYDGWFEEVFKRIEMRSSQRTADEQIKLEDKVRLLEQQHLQIMKNRYEMADTAYAFGRLKNKASKDDEQLEAERDDIRARRKEVEVRMMEADVRMEDLKQKLKEIREGKPTIKEKQEHPHDKKLRLIAEAEAAGEKRKREHPNEVELINRETRKIVERIREE